MTKFGLSFGADPLGLVFVAPMTSLTMDQPNFTDRGHRWLTLAGLPLLWVAVLSPWDRIFQEAMLIGLLAMVFYGKHQQRQTTISSPYQWASWFLLGLTITIILGFGWDFWRGQSPLEPTSVFRGLLFTGFPLLWGLILWLNFSGPTAKKLSSSALCGLILIHTFIGWAAWTTFSSQNPKGALSLVVQEPLAYVFFLALVLIAPRHHSQQFSRILWVVFGFFFLLSLAGLGATILGFFPATDSWVQTPHLIDPPVEGRVSEVGGRLAMPGSNANRAALMYGLAALLTLTVAWSRPSFPSPRPSLGRLMPWILLALLLSCIIATQTRTVLMALPLSLLFSWAVVHQYARASTRPRKQAVALLGFLTLLGLTMGPLVMSQVGILRVPDHGQLKRETLGPRIAFWNAGLQHLRTSPSWTGYGTKTSISDPELKAAIPKIYRKELTHFHHGFLQIAVETGWLGLGLILLILGIFWERLLKLLEALAKKRKLPSFLLTTVLAQFVFMILVSSMNHPFRRTAVLFWIATITLAVLHLRSTRCSTQTEIGLQPMPPQKSPLL